MSVEVAVVALGPDLCIGRGLQQLRGDAHPVARLAHAAFEHVRDVQRTRDLRRRDGLALVRERRIAGRDGQRRNAAEVGDDVLGDAVAEILLLRVAAHVHERQDDDRRLLAGRALGRVQPGNSRLAGARACLLHRAGCRLGLDQAPNVREQRLPALVRRLAIPARQVRRVRQLEDDRALARLDRHRNQGAIAIRERSLGAHPARSDGGGRPEYDHGIRSPQRALDALIEHLAGAQVVVPPDRATGRTERVGEASGRCRIFTRVRDEDVRHGVPVTRVTGYPNERTSTHALSTRIAPHESAEP